MANTGKIQARIMYRVRASDGAPLGIDGKPTSETGRLQAIALLQGTVNPNPLLYTVQLYYAPNAVIDGVPTSEFSDNCPAGYIFLTPAPGPLTKLTLATPTATFTVTSSGPWTVAAPAGIVVTPNSGPRDVTTVVLSRSGNGQGNVVFTNTATGQTASLYVISVDTEVWILQTGTWNGLGFWTSTGIWNY